MHEPKNRVSEPLPILEIRVDHADGSIKTDPNHLIGSAIWGMTGEKPDLAKHFAVPEAELFNPTELKPIEGVKSVLSGEPAVIYRSDDLEIPMTPEELFRFMKKNLRASEFLALRERFGDFFEIHDDFYTDEGYPLQPMDEPDEELTAGPSSIH